jgi:hypothetical protein
MRVTILRALVLLSLTVVGGIGVASAGAATARTCGSVSYALPNTGGHGHAALNNLTALRISCAAAREVAQNFLVNDERTTGGWHVRMRTVIKHTGGHAHSVGEDIFTRGTARIVGDFAN